MHLVGGFMPLEDLRKVAQAVSGLLVIDEAYVDFRTRKCPALTSGI